MASIQFFVDYKASSGNYIVDADGNKVPTLDYLSSLDDNPLFKDATRFTNINRVEPTFERCSTASRTSPRSPLATNACSPNLQIST